MQEQTFVEAQLHKFVRVLTVKVLIKCHTLEHHSKEEWFALSRRLIDHTMEGLKLTNGFCPDIKSNTKLCEAVVKDLQNKLCGKAYTKPLILLQDQAVETVIIKSLQAHISDLSARLAEKARYPCRFRKQGLMVLFGIGLVVGVLSLPFF